MSPYRIFKLVVVPLGLALLWFSCAHNFDSDFEGDVGVALIDTGAGCPEESSSKQTSEDHTANSVLESKSKIEKVFSYLNWCNLFPSICKVKDEEQTCTSTQSGLSTHYCKVDEKGNVVSHDFISLGEKDQKNVGLVGGCIARPIKDVWAVLLNFGVMKNSKIDKSYPVEIKGSNGNDKQQYGDHVVYVINTKNVVGSFVGDVIWNVVYFHTVSHGTYQVPKKVIVDFQRVSGSSFVEYIKGQYILDFVTPQVTSFVMTQATKATQYGNADLRRDLQGDLEKVRTQAPYWKNLPPDHPVESLDFSNIQNKD